MARAFASLRGYARSNNRRLSEVAEALAKGRLRPERIIDRASRDGVARNPVRFVRVDGPVVPTLAVPTEAQRRAFELLDNRHPAEPEVDRTPPAERGVRNIYAALP